MTAAAPARPYLIVALHFVLACAISWTPLLALDISRADDGWESVLTNPLLVLVKFGPSLAGLLAAAAFGAPGFARRATGSAGPGAYLGALTLAAALTLPAAFGVALALGIAIPMPGAAAAAAAISLIALRTLLGGGLGEEIGWRGVVLPALLTRLGPRGASLLLGVLWTAWHTPAFSGGATPWPILLLAQAVLTISLSFVFTWVYLRTGGALLLAILLHGALNGFNAWAETVWIPQLDDIGAWQIARIALVLAAGVAAAIAMTPRARADAPRA